jgi:Fic family protein
MSEKVPQGPTEPQQDRQSRVVRKEPLPELTAAQKAEQEATNTLLQYDRMVELIDVALHSKDRFRLRPSTLQELNRISIEGLEKEAGRWRDVPMEIDLSRHEPPHWRDVPRLVDEMCEYINDHWLTTNPYHLAAYVM